ncbi:MAG: acyl-CoA dehydratase activase [Pseudomonadota bacterium]
MIEPIAKSDSRRAETPVFVGVDVGASHTKVAIIDTDNHLLGHMTRKSGIDFSATADDCLSAALKMARRTRDHIAHVVSTGYGRSNVTYAVSNRTEIGCHAKGSYLYFPRAVTIVDIGGQDNKVIKLDAAGRRISFKMNRKCAAGTGAFLEEMSTRLGIPLSDMDGLARQATDIVQIGSYCTVFSATEVLEHIRHGKKVQDIIKGLFLSVIRRIIEMDSLTEQVVMTGGVAAHNPYLVELAAEQIGTSILVPPHPQLAGAIGAALYAREEKGDAV